MRIEPVKEKGFFDGIFGRQVEPKGLYGWLTTIDHKRIGILYLFTALFYLFVGGAEALAIRLQLHRPEIEILSPDVYNQMFTMHGTTMIFLVVMPLSTAFANFLVPLMIGARDVAFPRMNAFSYWLYLFGSILLNLSWFFDGGPNQGWFGYANLTSNQYSPGTSVDFWIIGLQILGVSSIVGFLNFVTTIINMRAPGMGFMRMPVFVWMTLITGFIVLLSFPAITIALVELMFDRLFDTNFFNVEKGGLPLLWQHLFWIFGHPEVYILILPAMGVVSEILPTFSRRPLFGYPLIVGSGVAIGFMGFTVWSHHMFTTGMGNIAVAAFSLTTMAIAVPTGVKIFNWVGTLWKGQLRMTVPMMFALAFIFQFMMGGFSGLMHASVPHDTQQHDTYFIVAHFHYVLFGGALFSLFGGVWYWMPKMSGRLASEKTGRIAFWHLFIGFNLTFFPMHWLGLNGMPRRIVTYGSEMGWNELNMLASAGAALMGAGAVIFCWGLYKGWIGGEEATEDPWDARTLEWSIASPPPVYNFKTTPVVHRVDDWWFRKHPELVGMTTKEMEAADADVMSHVHSHDDHGIHMPGGSIFPMIASFGITLGGFFMIFHAWTWAIASTAVLLFGVYGWSLEPIGGYYIHFDEEKASDASSDSDSESEEK